ncbi:hypothetical protein BRC75_09365 [Halobacteriales archaeon QH_7_69_31]|nr:MAG: hypothetical protein BRC75_09365 [Halobacteriales archaeon QH_7_69_31]
MVVARFFLLVNDLYFEVMGVVPQVPDDQAMGYIIVRILDGIPAPDFDCITLFIPGWAVVTDVAGLRVLRCRSLAQRFRRLDIGRGRR